MAYLNHWRHWRQQLTTVANKAWMIAADLAIDEVHCFLNTRRVALAWGVHPPGTTSIWRHYYGRAGGIFRCPGLKAVSAACAAARSAWSYSISRRRTRRHGADQPVTAVRETAGFFSARGRRLRSAEPPQSLSRYPRGRTTGRTKARSARYIRIAESVFHLTAPLVSAAA